MGDMEVFTPSNEMAPRPGDELAPLIQSAKRTLEHEARALAGLVETIGADFARACQILFRCRGTILLTGMGKSGLVARKWAATLSGTGTKAFFVNPAEAPHGDLGVVRPEDVLVALSYSGETEELGFLLRHAREMEVPCVGVTGNPDSSLGRQTSPTLVVRVSEEACPLNLAPTTSTTLMMALGDAAAVALMEMRGFTEEDFARLHPGGTLGRRLWLRVSELMHQGRAMPTVAASDTLDKVLIEMTQKCLGLAVVMGGESVKGIITDGDLRRHFQGEEAAALSQVTAESLMTPSPKTISAQALAVEAREMMEAHKIQQLLVMEGTRLLGVVHLYDLLRAKVM